MTPHAWSRREFLGTAGSCAAYLWGTLGAGSAVARRLFAMEPARPVVGREPWGRIERVAEGAWALVSTPLSGGPDAMRTVANGGIIAGREGVVLIEGLATEPGARWLAETARELTGRRPTHVVLTHYHGDHSHGLPAFETGETSPRLLSTEATRAALASRGESSDGAARALETLRGPGVELVEAGAADVHLGAEVDLGDRRLRVVPRSGHTRSDLVVVLEDPRVVWCGDLVWKGLFPNYMDATPSVLSRHVRALLEEEAQAWVPGHGSLADREALRAYIALLDDVEAAARRAIEAGTPVQAAAEAYEPPEALGEWVLFSPRYYAVAFGAWERELTGG